MKQPIIPCAFSYMMKLHEIIEQNAIDTNSILIELLLPYKKSLYTIFSREYRGEPVLMVTDVFNAAQYSKIVPANDFIDAVALDMHVSTPRFNSCKQQKCENCIYF